MAHYQEISVQDVAKIHKQGALVHLIDVREPDEYAAVSAPGSLSLPLSSLTPEAAEAQAIKKDDPIYMICRSGKRSARACEIFAAAGFKKLFNVEGGMLAWEAEGLPVR